MKLTDMIKKAAIGIAMTGALAGNANAQHPTDKEALKADMYKSLNNDLADWEGVCMLTNFAFMYGSARPAKPTGYAYMAFAKATPKQQEGMNIELLMNDENDNGPGEGDQLVVAYDFKGIKVAAAAAVDKNCGNIQTMYTTLDLHAFFGKYIELRNQDTASVKSLMPMNWAYADFTVKKGIHNAASNEYSLTANALRIGENGAEDKPQVCTYKVYDPNKNGLDAGDILSFLCEGPGLTRKKASTMLEGERGNIPASEIEHYLKIIPSASTQSQNPPKTESEILQDTYRFAAADVAYQKGTYDSLKNEFVAKYRSSFQKSENDPKIPLICELRLRDVNKNGVDAGDILTQACSEEKGTDSFSQTYLLDGKRGNFTQTQLDIMFPIIK